MTTGGWLSSPSCPGSPPGVPDFERWLSSLTGEGLSALLSGREETFFLRLSLPKFEQEWSGELKDALAALGLTDAFDPDGRLLPAGG